MVPATRWAATDRSTNTCDCPIAMNETIGRNAPNRRSADSRGRLGTPMCRRNAGSWTSSISIAPTVAPSTAANTPHRRWASSTSPMIPTFMAMLINAGGP